MAVMAMPQTKKKGAIRSLKTGSQLENQAGLLMGFCGFLGALHFQHRPTLVCSRG
jgi:hypothetical protein